MNIDIIKVGELKTNCYLVYFENKKCLIIDPGDFENSIVARIRKIELEPVGVITTHNHIDHTGCALSIANIYGVKVYDYDNMFEGINSIDDFTFEVIYTPGHEEKSICIYFKDYKVMFTGDFIFKDNIGRCDLPTGSFKDMLLSIEKIKEYDDDITLYPGHGELTNLGYEKENNMYFNYNK